VEIPVAGMGYKEIRVANLPPEVPDDTLRATLAPFGQVLNIQNEMWARTYRYTVTNGVRQVNMMLTKHVPSHVVIAGQRVLISYDGQPTTCYGCGDTGHLYPKCPRRQRRALLPSPTTPVTNATIAANMPQSSGDQLGENIHGDSSHLLEHVVESNDQNMEPPHGPERCTSPMDSTQDAELGNPQPPNSLHRNKRWSFRSHVVRRHRPLGKTNETCQQKPGTDAGHLSGKGDAVKSRQTPCHPLSSSHTSISNDDTMCDMEAPPTQHDDTNKPENTPASSKRPKNMIYDKLPDPPPEHAERSGVLHTKMGNLRCHSP
jgi:hypothetical protein